MGRRRLMGQFGRTTFAALLAMVMLGLSSRAEAQPRVHTVRSGETLSSIARRYRVQVDALREFNRLRTERIRSGQRLRIPRRARIQRTRVARRHRVRSGDTLARIARRYRSSVEAIRESNRLRSSTVRPGQILWIPRRGVSPGRVRAALRGENPVPDAPPPELDAETSAQAEALRQRLGLGSTALAQRLLSRGVPTELRAAAAGDGAPLTGDLAAPVPGGRLLRGWGSGAGGYHLALDLGGVPTGTEIASVERGIVAYAAHGLSGYGNLVVLVHSNGWVSAYAHNRRNLVVAGQRVARGQPIAELGQTGRAQGPHLHFMLVVAGEHCDAEPLLRPLPPRRDGSQSPAPTAWTEERPQSISCLPRSARPNPYYRPTPRRERRRR